MRLKSNIKLKKRFRVNERARVNNSLFIFIDMKLIGLLKEESTRQAIKARIKLGLSNIFLNKKID